MPPYCISNTHSIGGYQETRIERLSLAILICSMQEPIVSPAIIKTCITFKLIHRMFLRCKLNVLQTTRETSTMRKIVCEIINKQNHEALCCAIEHYRIVNNKKGIPTSVQVPNQSQWFDSKYQFMTAIQKILNRPLMRFEKQTFMFPRSCVTCHQQEDLAYCICASANFCSEHLDNNRHCRNDIVCDLMRISFALDNPNNWKNKILNMHYLQYLPYTDFVWREEEPAALFFFKIYIAPYVNLTTTMDFLIQINYHAQQIEAPLTLLFTMRRITYTNFENTLLIYVITDEFLDATSLHGWEILLHFILRLTNLRIVSIGPKLQFQPLRDCDYLCEKCILCRMKLSYASLPYPLLVATLCKPCLIISFNARIYEDKVIHIDLKTYDYTSDITDWKDILKYLADLEVGPVIVTYYNQNEAIENMSTINNILNKEQHVVRFENVSSGIKPYRNPETETVLFQNEHILVYKSLVENKTASTE